MVRKIVLFIVGEINKNALEASNSGGFKDALQEAEIEYKVCKKESELGKIWNFNRDKIEDFSSDKNAEPNLQVQAGAEDILFITDTDLEFFGDKCVIGYGRNYSGSAAYVIESLEGIDLTYLNMVYARYKGQPAHITDTERLVIREMSLEDLDAMYELYATLSECAYVEPLYERKKEEEFDRNYIEHMYKFFQYGLWLVFRKTDHQLIGRVGIENREIDGETRQEIGYLIGSTWQRQGYGHEACEAVIDYAAEYLGIEELFLCTEKENTNSVHFGESLGFSYYAEVESGAMKGYLILKKCLVHANEE